MRKDDPGPGIAEAGHQEQRIYRQHQDHRRQHLAGEHDEPQGRAAGVVAREGIGHRGRERQRDGGRSDRGYHAVEEVILEIIAGEDLDEVVGPERCPFRRDAVGRELVGERHPRQPDQRQQDPGREGDQHHMRHQPRRELGEHSRMQITDPSS
jgi:hypothetical protein